MIKKRAEGRDIVIFDLDGTLANIDHRKHFIETPTKDWASFNAACSKDTKISFTCNLLCSLASAGFSIYIITGRDEAYRAETVTWLSENNLSKSVQRLLMRPAKNTQKDYEWKASLVASKIIDLKKVQAVFEDRSSVVKMWRSLGLQVYQVADGNF